MGVSVDPDRHPSYTRGREVTKSMTSTVAKGMRVHTPVWLASPWTCPSMRRNLAGCVLRSSRCQ
jgi:hypothetical protein